ncbi:PepSY domain-containing protein [Niallia endozanthoxylica]|nr:PepSY domain-containing protein [Niallia endozanthoxylica]
MKRKVLIGTLGAALVFGGAFAVGAADNDNAKNEKTFLSTDKVEKIVLQEVDGVLQSIELEKELDKVMYEVDIEKNNVDYDLYIDAYSGEVYSVDRDDMDDDNDDNTNLSNGDQTNKNTISQADATTIAEKAVNGKVVEISKDEDDGFIKYEVELKTDRGEAEVEIDASTGKVLEVEWDD